MRLRRVVVLVVLLVLAAATNWVAECDGTFLRSGQARVKRKELATNAAKVAERAQREYAMRAWRSVMAKRQNLTSYPTLNSARSRQLANTHYKVITKASPPFVFINEAAQGSRRYTGYSIDLLEHLASELGFTYEINHAPAGTGANSLVDDVRDGTDGINLSIASFTITASRSKSVAFPSQYFDLGLRIVVKPVTEEPSMWQMFVPFSAGVWGGIIAAFLVVMFSFVFFEAGTNDSEFGHSKCGNLFLGMFYTFQTVVQQLSVQAETIPGRIVLIGSTAFFFVLAATYTAELAAFLTLTKVELPIYDINLDGTIDQNDLTSFTPQIAVLQNSAIEEWFVREILSSDAAPESATYTKCASFRECIQLVDDGLAGATLIDGPVAEYLLLTDFRQLELLGAPMNLQGYGVVMQHDDSNVAAFNEAILGARESGVLSSFYAIWFPRSTVVSAGDESLRSTTMHELGGIFIILAAILAIAWITHFVRLFLIKRNYIDDVHYADIAKMTGEDRLLMQVAMLRALEADGRLPERTVRNRIVVKSALASSIAADSEKFGCSFTSRDIDSHTQELVRKYTEP